MCVVYVCPFASFFFLFFSFSVSIINIIIIFASPHFIHSPVSYTPASVSGGRKGEKKTGKEELPRGHESKASHHCQSISR